MKRNWNLIPRFQVMMKVLTYTYHCVYLPQRYILGGYHDDYLEQLAEIDDEEEPELEEEDEEETEIEAVERMKSSIIEQFEEQIESISLLQVSTLTYRGIAPPPPPRQKVRAYIECREPHRKCGEYWKY